MSIKVHALNPDDLNERVVHYYDDAVEVSVLENGSLRVHSKDADRRVIGAYPSNRWTAAYEEDAVSVASAPE
ncbi:hypothetical protein [Rhodococcus pyridinivorans]|uniref:hypothetical protein n=1 Tax=Rhodococcus pyridinivorans TaxID=103816 RepID=UPI002283DF99|nr:hypothetical protein [Rhodococcus pyridinivorans]WAL48271.1 hypothetical protein OQN32_09485 [Rhodococcus pyridinivorans]